MKFVNFVHSFSKRITSLVKREEIRTFLEMDDKMTLGPLASEIYK